ncbi:MAG: hypothetical protein ACYC2R_02765 [Burkholderiales bacterium]
MKLLMSMLLMAGVMASAYVQAADDKAAEPSGKMEQKMEGKDVHPMPMHSHAVEKGTLPPQHKPAKMEGADKMDKEGKPMKRHEHSKEKN